MANVSVSPSKGGVVYGPINPSKGLAYVFANATKGGVA